MKVKWKEPKNGTIKSKDGVFSIWAADNHIHTQYITSINGIRYRASTQKELKDMINDHLNAAYHLLITTGYLQKFINEKQIEDKNIPFFLKDNQAF